MKGKHSPILRRISSVTLDGERSHPGNASARPAMSPEAVEDPPDQQREPNQSQIDTKSENNFECTEQERLSPNADETDLVKEGDGENEQKAEADILEGSQEIQNGSDVVAGERKTSQGSDSKPDDPLERPRSAASDSEDAEGEICEAMNETGVGDEEDQHTGDHDAEIGAQSPEQTELKDEEVETTKEPTEEENADRSCSAEPEMDSSFTLSKHIDRLISRERDHQARKRESRSFRYSKVP